MSETDLIRNIMSALEMRGYWCWRQNSGAQVLSDGTRARRFLRLAPPGTPDILVVLPPQGRLVGLEAKTAKGRQRPSQRDWQRAAERHGAGYAIVRSVSDALQAIEEMSDG